MSVSSSRRVSFDSKIRMSLSTRKMSRHSLLDISFTPSKGDPIQYKFHER